MTFVPSLSQSVCPARCVSLLQAAVMEEEMSRPAVSWPNGSLAPVDRLRSDRADSPTPGLVEGTEPGELSCSFSQFLMFVTVRSQTQLKCDKIIQL